MLERTGQKKFSAFYNLGILSFGSYALFRLQVFVVLQLNQVLCRLASIEEFTISLCSSCLGASEDHRLRCTTGKASSLYKHWTERQAFWEVAFLASACARLGTKQQRAFSFKNVGLSVRSPFSARHPAFAVVASLHLTASASSLPGITGVGEGECSGVVLLKCHLAVSSGSPIKPGVCQSSLLST